MKKNQFFIGVLLITVLFLFACGGGGGEANCVVNCGGGNVNPSTAHEYVVEYLPLNLAEVFFWSENGSKWDVKSRTAEVFQNGKSTQTQLEWDNFPIKDGDQLEFIFDGETTGSGNSILRVVEKLNGKTTAIYGQNNFAFMTGKNTVGPLTINGTNNQACVIMMLGEKSGRYQFLSSIIVKRTRIKTGTVKTIPINISAGKFGTDCGSIWNLAGFLKVVAGSQRASTKLEWEGIPFENGKISKVIITGYSIPAGDIVVQLRSLNQTLGEKTMELHGERMVLEIIPTGTDARGSLRILFPDMGEYHLEYLGYEID